MTNDGETVSNNSMYLTSGKTIANNSGNLGDDSYYVTVIDEENAFTVYLVRI